MAYKILSDDLTFANVNAENPKVCFLHGWGTSGKDFNKIHSHFDSITIDIPGFGKSRPFTQSFSPKSYAEYLIKLIPDSVDIIVGHSFGGRIAVHLSQMQNYKKIVIIASPLIRKNKPNNGFSVFKLYKFINKFNIISDLRLDELKNKYGSEDYRKANKVLKDTLVMAVNDDLTAILPKISSKVELIYGQDDFIVPVKVGIDSSSIIPDSELTIIPDEGHNMLRSSAEKIVEIIKR